MPIIRDHDFAAKLADKLKRILFFYQKSDTISRFERSKLMKEREKNSKKIVEWDKQSERLERKVKKGVKEIKIQEKELEKLREAIKNEVKRNLEYEGMILEKDIEQGIDIEFKYDFLIFKKKKFGKITK